MNDRNSEYLSVFKEFVTDQRIEAKNQYKESDIRHHVLAAMVAVQKDNKSKFEHALSHIKERQYDKYSQWIYDDIMLFVIASGVIKFGISRSWINDLCLTRLNSQGGEKKRFTESIHLTINGSSSQNSYTKVLLFIIAGSGNALTELELNNAFKAAKKDLRLGLDQIGEIIAQSSIEHIIVLKRLDDIEVRERQLTFIENFRRRSKRISRIVYNLSFLLLTLLFIYLIFLSASYASDLSEGPLAMILSSVISSAISLGPFIYLYKRKNDIITWFNKLIHLFWGKIAPSKLE